MKPAAGRIRLKPWSPPMSDEPQRIYGLLAEFESPEAIVEAAHAAHGAGFERVEAYTPFPIRELPEKLGVPRSRVPLIVLCGAIVGGSTGFAMQYYANVFSYVLDIGGKPPNSWPAFIPITFELTVLGAAFCAVFGMLALCNLPQPYHPLFNVERFAAATHDRFFLCIEAADPKFDLIACRIFLESLAPASV